MTRRKAVSKTQDRVEMLDRIFAQVDPEVLLAGALGAVATAGGITPPLTRMLIAFGGSDVTGPLSYPVAAWENVAALGSPLLFALGLGSSDGGTSADKATLQASMAAGALEAMIMMSAAKNPELVKALVDAGSSAAKIL